MTVIFDSSVHTQSEMRNLAFRQEIHRDAIVDMFGAEESFDMYDFQDSPILVGAMNKGTGGVLGNMAWDNAALRTGAGWYVPPQIAGAYGFGMVNDGGVSGHYGSVVGHNGNDVAGKDKFTLTFTINLATVGEGGVGTLLFKDGAYAVQFDVVDEIRFIMWDGAAWRAYETTDSPLASWNHWHQVTITYNAGTVVIYVDGIARAGAGALIPVVLHDAGNILYIMDNAANTSAVDGILGQLGLYPGLAMSAAQEQGLVELRGLFQPNVANHFTINTPGSYGSSDYTAVANSRMVSYQKNNFDGQTAMTIMGWFSIRLAAASHNTYRTFFSRSDGTLTYQSLFFWRSGLATGIGINFRTSAGLLQAWEGVNTSADGNQRFYAVTYDGANLVLYRNGEVVATTPGVGTITDNADQIWFGYDPVPPYTFNGGVGSKIIVRNDVVPAIEIARIAQSSGLGWQRQFGT